MSKQVRFARRTSVRRLSYRHSVLTVALVLSTALFFNVPIVAADDRDPGFGDSGIVTTDRSQFEQINDIVIQPDGKIVAVGPSGRLVEPDVVFGDIMVARYNIDGSLDATFGDGGIVTTRVSVPNPVGIALQADGKIVVAGGSGSRVVVVRYNTDGSLDDTFGFGGIFADRIGRSFHVMDLAIQSDDKIVIVGEDLAGSPSKVVSTLARLDISGFFLDDTFGHNGVSQPVPAGFSVSPIVSSKSIALQPDGKIVAAGVCRMDTLLFCVARYNTDGSFDNTFDGDGFVVIGGNAAEGISLQPDGKIVGLGQLLTDFGSFPLLVRLNTDGSLDTSFGNGGTTVIFDTFFQFRAESLAIKPNGKIVVAGERVDNEFQSALAVARYDSNGFLEDIVTTMIGDHAAANAVAIQPNDRIVAAGYGNFFNFGSSEVFSDFALVRFGINEAPTVSIKSPASGSIFAVNTPADFAGTFTDDPESTHTAEWFFESITQPGTVAVPADANFGFVNTTHTFTEPGIYRVSLKVTDDNLLSDTATTVDGLDALVVIYDPNGGWVAGGGWIDSPEGAFVQTPSLTGKANFAFVSKYQNGASVPTGNAQFQFNAAGLKFQSSSYEWLVISGGRKAQYKGVGTINGRGSYRFMLTAIDGDQPGGGGQDKFRIRIWSDSEGLIYDNQLNASDGDDPTTGLGGGSIVIHH